jgi:Sensors of blue-light using FAD
LATKQTELLLRLMYSSVSAPEMTPQALNQIFEAAIRNNQRDEITGALIANGRLNIQYLEGPEAAVRALWARIQSDSRHHSIVQLYEQVLQAPRLFPEWAMLRGQASKQEMLAMVRSAYLRADASARPEWAQSIGPLMILLDGEFSHVYAGDTSLDGTGDGSSSDGK